MSKEFQIRDGNLIASFDLENEDGDIDFCKLLKVSHGVADEIGMFVDYVATNKIIKDQSKKIADLETKLAECEKSKESYRLQNEQHHLQLLQFYSRLGVEAFGADIHEKALETLMIMKEELEEKNGVRRALSACNRQNDEFADMIKKLVNEKEELKQQLAESEKKAYSRGHSQRDIANEIKLNALREDVANKEKRIVELKQQLTEKEKENKTLKDIRTLERVVPRNAQLNKLSNRDCYLKGFENAISETIRTFEETYGKEKCKLIEERDKYLMDIVKVGGYEYQIEELKQQLTEKEKSLSIKSVVRTLMKDNNLNCTFRDKTNAQIQQCGDVYNSNYGYFNFEDDYDESLNNKNDNRFDITSIDLTNQDKISFAIEQLEQLKKLCQEKFNWWENSEWEGDIYDKSDVSNAYFDIEANIEEKIKQLKEKE